MSDDYDDNTVFLRGSLGAEAEIRVLPSGDELCAFRLTVARPPGERVRVDSIDCASMKKSVRRSVERSAPGDELEVTGRLHRRFWRGANGPASRYEVEVLTARRAGRRS